MSISCCGELLTPESPALPGLTLREHLARGASLDVFEAWDQKRRCSCIVKTLRPDHLHDDGARRRLHREGELLLTLVHPGLVRGYERYDEPVPLVVMETRAGETLGHLIERRRCGLSTPDLLELGSQLVSALGYLHDHDLLHLDLKPSNIVVDAGRAVLLDLSHARRPGRCPAGFGTAEYMSPEQLLGDHVTPASDVFGLAGVLYRAATRRRPFERRPRDPQRSPPFWPLRRRALPPGLVACLEAGLSPSPADRPTLGDMTDVLECAR